ncbi:MAG: DUF4168 domain-containing protein [Cyclobacteriaceae bacterium]|nr:DUF4168 domain-containing protein [Cyclobacteriaceae bacterium]
MNFKYFKEVPVTLMVIFMAGIFMLNHPVFSQQGDQNEELSDTDPEKFNKATEKVMEIQEETNAEVENAIEDSGINLEKYKEMMLAYQQSPEVQAKVHQILEDEQ